jgi:hypothetical protein
MKTEDGIASRVRAPLLVGTLAALFALDANAIELDTPHPGDMTRYELPGYTLVAVGNPQLRRDMTKLPLLKRALEISMGIEVKNSGIPTYFYVVSGSIWDRYLESSTGVVSDFMPTRFANYVIGNNVNMSREQLFHEHVHLYVYNQMPGVYPLWFDEGLAQMFDRAQYSPSNVRIFPRTGSDHFNWLPIERVLRATKTSPEYLDERILYGFHYQSRVMVQRALADDAEFNKQVFRYLAAINELKPLDEAEKELGDIAALDSRMHDYVNDSGLKKVTLKLDGAEELNLPAGTPVSKLDALLGIATICLDTGLGIERAHELLDVADKEPGGAARAAPLRIRLAARRKDDAELDRLFGLLSKDTSDTQVARGMGLALFDRSQSLAEASPKRTELMTRGFDLLNRSLAANADDPEAVWAYAMLAAELKLSLDTALQRLAPMFKKLPGNPDMAQATALVLQARGDQNVLPYLTAVVRNAHSLEQKRWAADRINAIRTNTAGSKPTASQ